MNIGQRIKELREAKGTKATFVAERVGISQPMLSMIEREKTKPTIDTVVALSDFFGVTTDYLLKGSNNESQSIHA